MKFPRARKSYVLISFGFVIAIFLFTHWRSYKILVQNNNNRNSERVLDKKLESLQNLNERSSKINGKNCPPENGLQTSAHCAKKGDDKNTCFIFIMMSLH